ncbi:MAG: polyphenol oxidase family protein [Candidatus Nanopelagicales bacterium]|nr:polyphenol oxidase family protein [Candidatus Nanopelagicales bacterium]
MSVAQIFDQTSFDSVKVIALSRNGGLSNAPFNSLNLADYVGDESQAVRANLALVTELAGASGIAVMSATHGNKVNVVSSLGLAPSGDGLVTRESNLALLALTADCVGFALTDSVSGVIAVGHAGWRGVLANVIQSVVDTFVLSGGKLAQTKAVIGPAICGSCYEVPRDRVSEFSEHPTAIFDETHLDLRAGVRSVLAKQIDAIYEFPGCTQESEDLFSYRKASGQPTGRGGLLVIRTSS